MFRMIFIALLTLSVVVACGDGKSKKRTPIRRDKTAQKGKDKPLTPEQKKAEEAAKKKAEADEKARLEKEKNMTPEEKQKQKEQDELDSKAAKERTAKLEAVAAPFDEVTKGEAIAKSKLPEGTYTLGKIVTFTNYQYKGEFNTIRTDFLNIDSSTDTGGIQLYSEKDGMMVSPGVIADSVVGGITRKIEVPGRIILNKGFEQADRSIFKNLFVFSSRLVQSGTTVTVHSGQLAHAEENSPVPVSMANMLLERPGMVKDTEVHTMNDGDKEVALTIVRGKTSDEFIFVFTITESKQGDQDNGKPHLVREVALVYKHAAPSPTIGI